MFSVACLIERKWQWDCMPRVHAELWYPLAVNALFAIGRKVQDLYGVVQERTVLVEGRLQANRQQKTSNSRHHFRLSFMVFFCFFIQFCVTFGTFLVLFASFLVLLLRSSL